MLIVFILSPTVHQSQVSWQARPPRPLVHCPSIVVFKWAGVRLSSNQRSGVCVNDGVPSVSTHVKMLCFRPQRKKLQPCKTFINLYLLMHKTTLRNYFYIFSPPTEIKNYNKYFKLRTDQSHSSLLMLSHGLYHLYDQVSQSALFLLTNKTYHLVKIKLLSSSSFWVIAELNKHFPFYFLIFQPVLVDVHLRSLAFLIKSCTFWGY